MPDYGLRVRKADGSILLDTSERITRLMWKSSHTGSAGNSGNLDQIEDLQTAQFAVPVNADLNKTAHIVSRSGKVISWTTWTVSTFLTPANCIIFCFAYT